MEFKFVAVNQQGQRVTGIREAQTKEHLARQLAKDKLQLVSSQFRFLSVLRWQRSELSQVFLLEFSRQMSVLLASGLSITEAFEIIKSEQKNKQCQACIEKILALVQQGQSVSAALKQGSVAFDRRYLEIIAVGEQTGQLARSFAQNHHYLAMVDKLKKQIKRACIYPMLVLLVSILVVTVLLVKVIPKFESLFASFSQPLPYATLQAIALSEFIQAYWADIVIASVATIGICLLSLNLIKVRFWVDTYKLKLPFFGRLLRFSLYSHFALNCHIMLAAGLPLHQVLEKLKQSASNVFFSAKLSEIQQQVVAGNSFYQSCLETQLFPPLFIQLLKVGEESGTLDERLKNLAEVYRERLDSYVKVMVTSIEPMIMIVMGVVIGGLVLIMYLPIFEMSTFL